MESKPSDLEIGIQTFRFGNWNPNLQIWKLESKPSDLEIGIQTFRFGLFSLKLNTSKSKGLDSKVLRYDIGDAPTHPTNDLNVILSN